MHIGWVSLQVKMATNILGVWYQYVEKSNQSNALSLNPNPNLRPCLNPVCKCKPCMLSITVLQVLKLTESMNANLKTSK